MGIIASVSTCFRKYADFSGKASRSEFWWFFGFSLFVCVAAYKLNMMGYAAIALILPISAVMARRFHDIGETVGIAVMCIVAPFVTFYFFSAIQNLIESRLGRDVPYGLIANIPLACAILFFGLILIVSLMRKDETSRASKPSRISPTLPQTAPAALNPAVKARLEAERKVTEITTSIMKAYGLEAAADRNGTKKDRTETDAAVAAACDMLIELCAYYGHGMYSPQFDKLFEEAGQRLQASGWTMLPEGGREINLNLRLGSTVVRDHASALRSPSEKAKIGEMLRAEGEKIAKRDDKADDILRVNAYYALGTADEGSFIAIEKSQPDYANTYLSIRLAFAQEDGPTVMKMLRSPTLYEAFRYSFSDCPPVYPAFGSRIITGYLPIRFRDGLAISLRVTDLGAADVKLLLDQGLHHAPCYVEFEMHERMM